MEKTTKNFKIVPHPVSGMRLRPSARIASIADGQAWAKERGVDCDIFIDFGYAQDSINCGVIRKNGGFTPSTRWERLTNFFEDQK